MSLITHRPGDVTGVDDSLVSHGKSIKSVYVYEAPVRIWHWINAASILVQPDGEQLPLGRKVARGVPAVLEQVQQHLLQALAVQDNLPGHSVRGVKAKAVVLLRAQGNGVFGNIVQ